MLDEYPTYEEWIQHFDMDTDTPDMKKLEPFHFRHLPVWSDGNAYFGGAKAWKNEQNYLLDADHDIKVELISQDGAPCLSTNLYDYLNDFSAEMIHSDTLGLAFEPEQRFENPDGTALTFDRDYFGGHRALRFFLARSPARKTPRSRCGRGFSLFNDFYRNLPVTLSGVFFISSGFPVATIRPPSVPPPGPISMM